MKYDLAECPPSARCQSLALAQPRSARLRETSAFTATGGMSHSGSGGLSKPDACQARKRRKSRQTHSAPRPVTSFRAACNRDSPEAPLIAFTGDSRVVCRGLRSGYCPGSLRAPCLFGTFIERPSRRPIFCQTPGRRPGRGCYVLVGRVSGGYVPGWAFANSTVPLGQSRARGTRARRGEHAGGGSLSAEAGAGDLLA
jgi:hypothetical protein